MPHPTRPLLHFFLLLAIGVRVIVGAPCCLPPAEAAQMDHGAQAHHDMHDDMAVDEGERLVGNDAGHGDGHGDDPSANPCCSACGPTLPSEPVLFASRAIMREVPAATAIRVLATRPPFPAYEARGPPLLV